MGDRGGAGVRFVVIGAGAVGGVVGARLYQHGTEVALVARGAHLDAMTADGLRVRSPDDDVTVWPTLAATVGDIEWREGDVVLLAVKSQDSDAVLHDLSLVAPVDLPVVCMQNGVGNERLALRHFDNVYGMCVMLPAAHLEPGVVLAYSSPITGLLDLGRYPASADGPVDPLALDVSEILRSSSFDSFARGDIMEWKYTKLLMNLPNAVEAACGPAARAGEFAAKLREEGVAVLDAAGIAHVSDEEDRRRRGKLLSMRPISGERRGGGSSWQSLARGTGAIEADQLNGEVVLLGRLHGVETPANALIQRVANTMAAAGAEPGSVEETELLGRLHGE